MAATAPAATGMRDAFNPGRAVRRQSWTLGVIALLAVEIFVQTRLNAHWGSFDVQTLAIAALPLAFAAMGQALIIIGGGVDLSLGNQMALYNVIAARWMNGGSFEEALLISLAIILLAVAIGAATGLVIGLGGIPDIVVTLATSFVWLGVSLEILGLPGGGTPIRFANLAQVDTVATEWIPLGAVILLAAWAVIWLPFRRSRLGLAVYAIGSDRNAAYLSGVNIFRTRIVAYAVAGIFVGLAGLALTATTGTGDANAGQTANYTLLSVAASVLGGVSLAGGVGGLLGPLVGAFILQLVSTILLLLNVDPNYGQVIQGSLIILVVAIGGLLLLRRRA